MSIRWGDPSGQRKLGLSPKRTIASSVVMIPNVAPISVFARARTRCASVCRTGWFTGTGTITQVPMASVRCAGHAAIGRLLPAAGKNPGKNPAVQKLKKTLGLNSTVREKDSTVLTFSSP